MSHTREITNQPPEVSPIMQQIGMLNLRINDMMTQLNVVMKTIMEENTALKKENAELKTKQEKTTKA
jgi:regulator of replication initiation timing